MVVPELSLMNINHRYYSIETFFKAAGEAGYRNIELWTGSMHLYVDCHEHDSVDKSGRPPCRKGRASAALLQPVF